MTVLNQLACALGRADEAPNKHLAERLATKDDREGVREIVENLHNKDKNIQSDCIKVLGELAELNPSMIAPYSPTLLPFLEDKNNRLQWGAMAVLDGICLYDPVFIFKNLGYLLNAAENGSVITKDRCMNILIKMCGLKKYAASAFPLLFEMLLKSLPNQLPTYADNTLQLMKTEALKKQFVQILTARLSDIEKETKQNRVKKIIKKAGGSIG